MENPKHKLLLQNIIESIEERRKNTLISCFIDARTNMPSCSNVALDNCMQIPFDAL